MSSATTASAMITRGRAQLGCNAPHDHGKAVRYERLPAGAVVALAMPARPDAVAERVPSDYLLRTRALDAPRRPVVHCPSFLNSGRCVRGADCEYAHLVPPTGAGTRYDAASALTYVATASESAMPWYARSAAAAVTPCSALAAIGGDVAHAAAASAAAEALLRDSRLPDGGRRRRRRGLNRAARWSHAAAAAISAASCSDAEPPMHGAASASSSSLSSSSGLSGGSQQRWRHDPYGCRAAGVEQSPTSSPGGSFTGTPLECS